MKGTRSWFCVLLNLCSKLCISTNIILNALLIQNIEIQLIQEKVSKAAIEVVNEELKLSLKLPTVFLIFNHSHGIFKVY